MKRRWEVIKAVLESVEQDRLDNAIELADSKSEAHGDEFIGHLWLCEDAGLVAGVTVSRATDGHHRYVATKDVRLTMLGHDVLDGLRSDTVMNKAFNAAEAVAMPVTVELIKEALKFLAKSAW